MVPANGFAVTIPSTLNSENAYVMTPNAGLASGTLTMPATSFLGQVVSISTSKAITAFTLSANAGQTILNAPTTLAAGAFANFIFDGATWHTTG